LPWGSKPAAVKNTFPPQTRYQRGVPPASTYITATPNSEALLPQPRSKPFSPLSVAQKTELPAVSVARVASIGSLLGPMPRCARRLMKTGQRTAGEKRHSRQ
jgi:hypothetical protein